MMMNRLHRGLAIALIGLGSSLLVTGAMGATDSASGVGITDIHGSDILFSTGEYASTATNPKYFVNAQITGATAAADGTVTVNFTVHKKDNTALTGLATVNVNISKLVADPVNTSIRNWVPYIYVVETVNGTTDPAGNTYPKPSGNRAERGGVVPCAVSSGALTDHGDGSYTCVLPTKINAIVTPVSQTAITYDRGLTHRVAIMMGGHAGPTADAFRDFVPSRSAAVVAARTIVPTSACVECHGQEFHGHGGDRLSVEVCDTCHNPSGTDAHSGNTLDMRVMVHKIHAGGELPNVAGEDGDAWSKEDNGQYAIWGYQNTRHSWEKVGFPAVLENCTKCHQSSPSRASNNWRAVPSRAACGSCHDNVDFTTGTNHPAGIQNNDAACTVCHPATGTGFGKSITEAHNWTAHDPRNTPEFDVVMTVSHPNNGKYFVAGETPVVSIQLLDKENGNALLDHTTLLRDAAAEGCTANSAGTGCNEARDGKLMARSLYIHGPRGHRMPVLTTAARVAVFATGAGPFDLTGVAATDKLTITFDSGRNILIPPGQVATGIVGVTVAGSLAGRAGVTAQELMSWLNNDVSFKARGIAYIDELTGNLAIRSRNLGTFYAVQLTAGTINTAVFGGNTTVSVMGSSAVNIAKRDTSVATDTTPNNPKVAWYKSRINYTMDPVDDLKPGTYVATVELSDRGTVTSGVNYKTPSVAKVTFQVGQEAEEKAPAGSCGSCHQGPDGRGFVLDYVRHHKIFDDTAIDQCGACHDYLPSITTTPVNTYLNQPASATSNSLWGSGGKPISKRVHAVHYGSSLNYPLLTVDHSDGNPLRNWDITLPQNALACESCHDKNKSSGSWKTQAARIPCSGCHDSDEASAHMKVMTYDPTPGNPWNGDEEESCKACH